MMDEDLHRVLLFLIETLNKIPGWTHQGALKQQLFTAPLDGSLHRMLGASSAETFTEFLKCFPGLFCINSNQLVQLNTKNGSVSDTPGPSVIDGGGGPLMKLHEDRGGIPNPGVLPVGTRKPPDPHPLEWSAPLTIVPDTSKLGFLGREQHGNSVQMPASMCGIPASYPGSSGLGPSDRIPHHRSGWDPVAHSLPDLHQSFLSSDISRGGSIGHLANGWDRSVRATPAPNPSRQQRFSESGAGDSRLLNHRYTWESATHSITDSLKNFTISDPGYGVGSTAATADSHRDRWLPYSSMGADGLDSYPNRGSGDGRFVRPISGMWDDPIRPPTPVSQQQQGFLNSGAGDGGLPTRPTYKWDNPMPAVSENNSSLGYTGFNLGAKQQYYDWKSSSPIVENPAHFSSPEPNKLPDEKPVEQIQDTIENVVPAVVTTLAAAPVAAAIVVVPANNTTINNTAVPATECPPPVPLTPTAVLEETKVESPPQVQSKNTAVANSGTPLSEPATPKQGATLSYAEALRSNTQRRKTGSESSPATSSNSVQSPHPVLVPPATLKLPVSGQAPTERLAKTRRSLDGRCGKVEVLNLGDGTLRLGNGKVYFEKNIFYDNGKQISDLRSVLKLNDTVYFDAVFDCTGNYEWKATLAWVGKKPRLASASSPTTSTPSGRGYRTEIHGGNGISSIGSMGRGSANSNNKVAKDPPLNPDATVDGTGEVVILFPHFGFIRRGKKFKENVHFNRNVFYANGNRVKELTDVLKEGSIVNYVAVPSDKKSCKWKAVLVWTGTRPKV